MNERERKISEFRWNIAKLEYEYFIQPHINKDKELNSLFQTCMDKFKKIYPGFYFRIQEDSWTATRIIPEYTYEFSLYNGFKIKVKKRDELFLGMCDYFLKNRCLDSYHTLFACFVWDGDGFNEKFRDMLMKANNMCISQDMLKELEK